MKFFYIATQANQAGLYEIHERGCDLLPPIGSREYIGLFKTAKEALRKAIHAHPNASLCSSCCKSVQQNGNPVCKKDFTN
jgi:hypothetical protein